MYPTLSISVWVLLRPLLVLRLEVTTRPTKADVNYTAGMILPIILRLWSVVWSGLVWSESEVLLQTKYCAFKSIFDLRLSLFTVVRSGGPRRALGMFIPFVSNRFSTGYQLKQVRKHIDLFKIQLPFEILFN